MEIWKEVIDFPEYEVSSLGHIRKGNFYPTTRQSHNGYSIITLSKDGLRITKRVHRLVCEAFHENPENKPTVDHIDRNIHNNCADNLRWASAKEQANNRGAFPLRGTNTGHAYITFNKNFICAIRNKGRKSFKTLEEAIQYRDELLS
jgi:hypothetical protein